MFLAILDYDHTLTTNDGVLLDKTIMDINKFVLKNKLCILSEATFNELNEIIESHDLNCDFFSISSAKGKINNKLIFSSLNHNDLNFIINKYNNELYTAFFEDDNNSYVIKYQERLDLLYPKKNRQIITNISEDINSIIIAMNNINLENFYKDLDDLNLDYIILAKDKNRNLVKISSNKYSKKSKIVYLLKDIYKDCRTIGVSDSINDLDFVSLCDIKIAMKKSELESKLSITTDLDNSLNGCMDKLFKII